MNKEQLAGILDGMEYPLDLSREFLAPVAQAGLVIIYGDSDDLMTMKGALDDQYGCYEGGVALLDAEGLLPDWESVRDEDEEAGERYCRRKAAGPRTVEALWGKEGFSWTYKTDIPHATFIVEEDGEKFCRGIVFSLADLVVVADKDAALQAANVLATAAEGLLETQLKLVELEKKAFLTTEPWDANNVSACRLEIAAALDGLATASQAYRAACT